MIVGAILIILIDIFTRMVIKWIDWWLLTMVTIMVGIMVTLMVTLMVTMICECLLVYPLKLLWYDMLTVTIRVNVCLYDVISGQWLMIVVDGGLIWLMFIRIWTLTNIGLVRTIPAIATRSVYWLMIMADRGWEWLLASAWLVSSRHIHGVW